MLLWPLGCSSSADRFGFDDGGGLGGGDATTDGGNGNGSFATDGGVFQSGGDSATVTGCASADAKPSRVPVNVWLVVDLSNYEAAGAYGAFINPGGVPANQTYLWTLRSTLLDPGGLVPSLQSVEAFGFVGYESGASLICNDGTCVVPDAGPSDTLWCPDLRVVAPALMNEAPIETAFPSAVQGNAPVTYRGLRYVYDHLPSPADIASHPQVIILAFRGTNDSLCGDETTLLPPDVVDAGAPSATPAMATESVIYLSRQIAATGTKIFVLNNDETDPAALQAEATIAQIGNTGFAPLTPQSADDLKTGLQQILTTSVSCDVALNGTVTAGQACTGAVSIDGSAIPCQDPNGWSLKDPSTIEFSGAACKSLQANPDAVVKANFPCNAFTPPK